MIKVGEATNTLVFLNMNWNVIDASDIFKVCEDIVTADKLKIVKICKKKSKENIGDVGECKDLKEYQNKTLQIVKSSFVALVVFESVETAIQVYNELDSTELGNSGMFFDIRFVDENIKTGEVIQTVTNGEGFFEKDYNKFRIEETPSENKRGKLLEKLFSSKKTDEKLLNELISISDNEEEEEDVFNKKKKLFEEIDEEGKDKRETQEEERKDKRETQEEERKDKRETQEEERKDKREIQEDEEKSKREIQDEACKQTVSSHVFDPLDPRFSMLYTDSDFTIDPAHPEYQKNNKLKEIMKEKRRRYEGM